MDLELETRRLSGWSSTARAWWHETDAHHHGNGWHGSGPHKGVVEIFEAGTRRVAGYSKAGPYKYSPRIFSPPPSPPPSLAATTTGNTHTGVTMHNEEHEALNSQHTVSVRNASTGCAVVDIATRGLLTDYRKMRLTELADLGNTFVLSCSSSPTTDSASTVPTISSELPHPAFCNSLTSTQSCSSGWFWLAEFSVIGWVSFAVQSLDYFSPWGRQGSGQTSILSRTARFSGSLMCALLTLTSVSCGLLHWTCGSSRNGRTHLPLPSSNKSELPPISTSAPEY